MVFGFSEDENGTGDEYNDSENDFAHKKSESQMTSELDPSLANFFNIEEPDDNTNNEEELGNENLDDNQNVDYNTEDTIDTVEVKNDDDQDVDNDEENDNKIGIAPLDDKIENSDLISKDT